MNRVKAAAVVIEDRGLRTHIRNLSWRMVALALSFYLVQDLVNILSA